MNTLIMCCLKTESVFNEITLEEGFRAAMEKAADYDRGKMHCTKGALFQRWRRICLP